MMVYGMCQFDLGEFVDVGKPCYSRIGLREVAYITVVGKLRGSLTLCATHRRWLAAHEEVSYIDPATARADDEGTRLLRQEEQDIEDIADSDGRLLPRGLR